MLIMILSDMTSFLFVPLLLAALILAIVATVHGRRRGGLLLLLASLIIPAIALCFLAPFGLGNRVTRQEAALSELSLEVTSCRHESGQAYVEGLVRNDGHASVTYVKVGAEIQAEDGRRLASGWAYLVRDHGLEPGAEQPFEVVVPYDPRMSTCEAYLFISR